MFFHVVPNLCRFSTSLQAGTGSPQRLLIARDLLGYPALDQDAHKIGERAILGRPAQGIDKRERSWSRLLYSDLQKFSLPSQKEDEERPLLRLQLGKQLSRQ